MYQNKRKLDFNLIGMAIKKAREAEESNRRKQINVLLNGMEEKELIIMEATAQGLKSAQEIVALTFLEV